MFKSNPFHRRKKPEAPGAREMISAVEAANDKGYEKIKLGDLVKDRITGKQGTATERHYHLNGCQHVVIEVDGDDKDPIVPVQRLELVESRPQFHREDESMVGSHVKLGDEVKDKLSGFKGHVIGWAVTLFGAHRIIVDPGLKKDGTLGDSTYFDECRLELVTAKDPPSVPQAKRKTAKEKGGPTTSIRRSTQRRDTMAR